MIEEGIFVVFESLDAGGKTSIAQAMAKLVNNGEYYKGPPPEISQFRSYITTCSSEMQYGYYLAGNFVMSSYIKAKLEQGVSIFCDRYIYSTIAYFSVLLGKDLLVPDGLLKPNTVIYLETDEQVRSSRLQSRGIDAFHEKSSEISLKEKYQYERILSSSYLNLFVIDTSSTIPEEVAQHIKDMLKI